MDKRKDDTARRSVLHIWEEDDKSHILCVKDDEMDSDRMALSATALRKLLSNPGDTPEVEVFDIPVTSGGDNATLS